jgi:LacI family transcriptional regulator
MDLGLLREPSKRGVPIAFMDVGQIGPRMCHVSIDYGNGIHQAVDHVVGLGHTRIAFISGPLALHSARTRRQAFVDRMRAHRLTLDRRLIREGTHTADGGQREASALLRLPRKPTAVIASNDWTAIGALHAIQSAGLRVPEDISLVGFDDIPLVSYTTPALTTVRMSAVDVGSTAFQSLFRMIGGELPEGDLFPIPTKLVVRHSTARAKP